MLNELKLWSKKLKDGADIAHNFHFENSAKLSKQITKIAFFGMGGSGISGRIIKTFLDKKTNIPSFIVDGSEIPNFIDGNTLAIVVSYSGNTWETVENLKILANKFIPTVVMTHGGQAAELAEKNNIPFAILPDSLQPRFSLGNCLGFILTLFSLMEILPEGRDILDLFIKNSEIFIPKLEDESFFKDFLDLAEKKDYFYLWGVAQDSESFAYRAQTQFNENSKVPVVSSTFPELAHNLLVGFSDCNNNPLVVLFYSEFLKAHLEIAIDSMCQIIKEKGVELYKPPIFGDTWESQLFNMILWSDFASYFLGKRRNVDTVNVKIIEDLKAKYQQKQKNMK